MVHWEGTGNAQKSDLKRIDEMEESPYFVVLFETSCFDIFCLESFFLRKLEIGEYRQSIECCYFTCLPNIGQ